MAFIMEDYDITLASAATHYNHAFQQVKKESPAEVEGLGRADDKKGGRKPKAKPAAADALPADFVDAESIIPTEYEVKKCKDGSVLAAGLTLEVAKAMVKKAAEQKKAKLYWI